MKITIGISNHHVHITKDDLDILFGKNYELTKYKDINQPGQYSTVEKVDIKINDKIISDFRIVGPVREYTQVELTKTDCEYLQIDAPMRDSGNLKNAAILEIIGPQGSIIKNSGIIADRHIHVTKKIRKEKELENIDFVKIKLNSGKILDNVRIKETKEAYFEMHIDTDDSNEYNIKNGDIGEIIYE